MSSQGRLLSSCSKRRPAEVKRPPSATEKVSVRVALCSRFPAAIDQPKGGVESATVGLVRGLGARGDLDVHVVTLERGAGRVRVERHGGATVHRLPARWWPMIADVFVGPGRAALDGYLRSLTPEIVHFHETYGFGARGFEVPVIFTVHGFDSLNLRTEKRRAWWLRSHLWRQAERIGIGRQEHLVSIAPYVTAELRALSNATIDEIPNAISPEFFDTERADVPGRVLFAGWLNPRKNLLTALQAVKRLVDRGVPVDLHAAGAPVDAAYTDRVREYIRANGLERHARLLGRIGRDDMRREMSEACALVLPSLQENAPMVIAEALATGLPVVAADACGIPDMVEECETGYLIDPMDAGMIAERLARIFEDEPARAAMSALARRRARERWHPASVADKTVRVYRRLLAERGHEPRPYRG
jgi:glycosyltransferase involved in cell wall biosynthesis